MPALCFQLPDQRHSCDVAACTCRGKRRLRQAGAPASMGDGVSCQTHRCRLPTRRPCGGPRDQAGGGAQCCRPRAHFNQRHSCCHRRQGPLIRLSGRCCWQSAFNPWQWGPVECAGKYLGFLSASYLLFKKCEALEHALAGGPQSKLVPAACGHHSLCQHHTSAASEVLFHLHVRRRHVHAWHLQRKCLCPCRGLNGSSRRATAQ